MKTTAAFHTAGNTSESVAKPLTANVVQLGLSNCNGTLHLVYTPTLGVYVTVSLPYWITLEGVTNHAGLIKALSIISKAIKLPNIHKRLLAVTMTYNIL